MGLAVSNRDLTMGKSGNDSKSVLGVDDHQMQSKQPTRENSHIHFSSLKPSQECKQSEMVSPIDGRSTAAGADQPIIWNDPRYTPNESPDVTPNLNTALSSLSLAK